MEARCVQYVTMHRREAADCESFPRNQKMLQPLYLNKLPIDLLFFYYMRFSDKYLSSIHIFHFKIDSWHKKLYFYISEHTPQGCSDIRRCHDES